MKVQNQPDEHEEARPIIEDYRGPLLEQLREPQADAQITISEQQPPLIYEQTTRTRPWWQRAMVWLMVRLLNLHEWMARQWPWLMGVLRSEDQYVRQGRRGIVILLLVGLGEVIASLIPWFKALRFIPIIWLFFLALGVLQGASTVLYYHRSSRPRLALWLGISVHVLAIAIFLLPLLF